MKYLCGKCSNVFEVTGIKESVVTCSKCSSKNSIKENYKDTIGTFDSRTGNNLSYHISRKIDSDPDSLSAMYITREDVKYETDLSALVYDVVLIDDLDKIYFVKCTLDWYGPGDGGPGVSKVISDSSFKFNSKSLQSRKEAILKALNNCEGTEVFNELSDYGY